MSRSDNKLPPIGPVPGAEAWGFDWIVFPTQPLEARMDKSEVKAQLEQRFHVAVGKIIKTELGKYRVAIFDHRFITLAFLDSNVEVDRPFNWAVLYRLNQGTWEVVEE